MKYQKLYFPIQKLIFQVKSFKIIFLRLCVKILIQGVMILSRRISRNFVKNMYWLDDYSEFSVIKQKTKYSTSWSTWSEYQNILDSEKDVKFYNSF